MAGKCQVVRSNEGDQESLSADHVVEGDTAVRGASGADRAVALRSAHMKGWNPDSLVVLLVFEFVEKNGATEGQKGFDAGIGEGIGTLEGGQTLPGEP